MSDTRAEETFYDILKVGRKATIAEIVAAYHSAKSAFARDSVATYSLFSADEAKGVLDKLEEAYLNLSNIDKKREYDKWLAEKNNQAMIPPTMTELERKQNAQLLPKDPNIFPEGESASTAASSSPKFNSELPAIDLNGSEPLTGEMLRNIREKRALSLDDVSRITKIPSKFIRAIEADDFKHLPARVYLQGFVKNLSALYKIDAKAALSAYFLHADKVNPPSDTP